MSKTGKCNEDLSSLDLWLRTAEDLKNGHFGLRFSFLVKAVFYFLNRQRARMHVHDIPGPGKTDNAASPYAHLRCKGYDGNKANMRDYVAIMWRCPR